LSVDFKQNYFQIFQLNCTFQVDLEVLSTRFHDLQQAVHPDKFVSASEQDKRLAVQWATQVNKGYDTLKNPMLRAIYLLELKQLEIEHNPNLAPAFLMQQVELREALEEIEDEGEQALPQLDKYKKTVKKMLLQLEDEFSTQYLNQAELHKATQTVYKMQFTNKLLIAVNQLEEKLLDY